VIVFLGFAALMRESASFIQVFSFIRLIVGGIARGVTDEEERRKMMFQVRPHLFLVRRSSF
jgi:hypothetical protein